MAVHQGVLGAMAPARTPVLVATDLLHLKALMDPARRLVQARADTPRLKQVTVQVATALRGLAHPPDQADRPARRPITCTAAPAGSRRTNRHHLSRAAAGG